MYSGHDTAWFAGLYTTWHGEVLRYALRRVPAHEADDVVAEVFATAWRRRDDVDDVGVAWLLRTAAHHIQHANRGAARRDRLTAKVSGHAVPPCAPTGVDIPPVLVALASLSVTDQEVLRLSAWEQLTPGELGVVLGCTAATARVRLHRARRRLATALRTIGPSEEMLP